MSAAQIYAASDLAYYYDAMMEVVDNAEFNTTTRYDFIKSVHDYLCNSVSYIDNYASCHDRIII